MFKIYISALLLSLSLAVPCRAQAAAAGGQDCGLYAADVINRTTIDLQAKYWAWRISLQKDLTYTSVERESGTWPMSPQTRAKFLEKLKERVLSGSRDALTKDEELRLDQTSILLTALLDKSGDAPPARELTDTELIELNARATVLSLKAAGASGKDIELAGDFAPEFKAAIIKRTRELLKKGDFTPLTEQEDAELMYGNQRKTEEYSEMLKATLAQ